MRSQKESEKGEKGVVVGDFVQRESVVDGRAGSCDPPCRIGNGPIKKDKKVTSGERKPPEEKRNVFICRKCIKCCSVWGKGGKSFELKFQGSNRSDEVISSAAGKVLCVHFSVPFINDTPFIKTVLLFCRCRATKAGLRRCPVVVWPGTKPSPHNGDLLPLPPSRFLSGSFQRAHKMLSHTRPHGVWNSPNTAAKSKIRYRVL